jgi:hypothetical protein
MDNVTIISKGNICYILIMILSVITVASFGSISHISAISGNDNLTKVFDCINQKANERANLSLVDSFVCYDKELSGASKYSGEPYQNPDLSSLSKVQPVSFNTPVNTGTSDKGEDKFAFTPINENVKTKPNSKINKQSDDNKGIHLSQENSGHPNKHKITKQSSDPTDTVTSPNPQSKSPADSITSSDPTDLIHLVLPFSELGSP